MNHHALSLDTLSYDSPEVAFWSEQQELADSVRASFRKKEIQSYAAPDSSFQATFGGEAAVLSKFSQRPLEIKSVEFVNSLTDAQFFASEKLWNDYARSLAHKVTSSHHTDRGVAGDPIPYTFRNDHYVTSVLMLSFFLMVWVIGASFHFLQHIVSDFFHERNRPYLFTDRVGELKGKFFLVIQACFLQSMLFLNFTQEEMPDLFEQVSPHTLLLSTTTLIALYHTIRIGLYQLANRIFFKSEAIHRWNNHLLVSILLTGCLLFPLILLIVFFDLDWQDTLLYSILLITIIKSLLLYKCYRIFFNSLLGSLHAILYFCALEIVPLLFFWGVLLRVAHQLVVFS